MRTERLQALADGVFAIALTLLVLELPTPVGSAHLARDLVHQWPFYAAYVVSFATVAIVWLNHHAVLTIVDRADRALVELNLVLLLLVALVPWPTGLLAEYLRDPQQSSAAAVTYGLVMTLMAGSFAAIWLRLCHAAEPRCRPQVRSAFRRSVVGPVVYGSGTLVALASASVAFGLFAFAAGFFAVSGRADVPRRLDSSHGHSSQGGDP
jgi:TMEM175 potassium channel family protein